MKPARLLIWLLLAFVLIIELSFFFTPQPVRSNSATYPVISEVQIAGDAGANDEFIELYNPTGNAVDISSWSIQTENIGGSFSKKNFVSPAVIPAYGYYLITNNTYNGYTAPDLSHNSFTMSSTGVTIFLVNNQTLLVTGTEATIVDKVGIGSSALDAENSPFTPVPASNESAERKANSQSDSQSMGSGGSDELAGNGHDSDDNLNDFIRRPLSQPQNSNSPTEIFATPTVAVTPIITPIVTSTPTPTPTPTLTPTPTATLTPASTPTPSLTPSVTPSPTPSPTPTLSPSPSPTPSPVVQTPTITPSLIPSPTPELILTPTPTPTPNPDREEIIRIVLPNRVFVCTLEYRRIKWLFGYLHIPRIECGYQ